jgi:PhzF family phenazine biosynthesis protein
MPITVFQVDAFTDLPFRGNPAAVCLLDAPRSDAWLQDVGREMNLSETAFLVPRGDGFDLRWFTPAVEVDLCGHATLASAHALWETGRLAPHEIARFHTRSGLLTATRRGGVIELDFPADPAIPEPPPTGLRDALGVELLAVEKGQYDYLVEVENESVLRAIVPDFALLAKLPARGVAVTSRSASPQYDFVSRFFAPAAGIDEDPVTGSAHCALAPYWGARLGKTELVAYQASARGGVLHLRLAGERVLIAGHAITVLRGELVDQPSSATSRNSNS